MNLKGAPRDTSAEKPWQTGAKLSLLSPNEAHHWGFRVAIWAWGTTRPALRLDADTGAFRSEPLDKLIL